MSFPDVRKYRETQRLEAKLAQGGFPLSLWETYSAFANAEGGVILLGVAEAEDKTLRIAGLEEPEAYIEEFLRIVNDPRRVSANILDARDVQIIETEGKRILLIHVPRAEAGDRPLYLDGEPFAQTYRRIGEGDFHCPREEVLQMLQARAAARGAGDNAEGLFTPITLADKEKLTPELTGFHFVDLGFTGLYYCAEAFGMSYAFLRGVLCLRIAGDCGAPAYVLSDMSRLSELAALLFELTDAPALCFDFIEEAALDKVRQLSAYTSEISSEDKYADYYSTYADYVTVDKQAAPHKYKDYNRFCKRYSHSICVLDKQNIGVARELLARWCALHGCDACTTGCEKQWILRLLDGWEQLDARGLIVSVEGVPEGFCLLEKNGETILRLVSKSAGRQLGLQVFMGIESARLFFPEAKYVNMGPDSGVAGLREFKDKFRPYVKLKKYRVKLTRK